MSEAEAFIQQVCTTVPGMMNSPVECLWLYEAAKCCSHGVIVEIGSCAGMSTISLGGGSRAGNKVKVYAVDPFNGGGGTPDPTWWNMDHEGTPKNEYYINQAASLKPFMENVRRFNLEDIITPIVDYSELAIKKYPGDPIEFLFIDGDHRYNYVKLDVQLWTPFMISGGIVALHDSDYHGVNRVIKEIISDPKCFQISPHGPVFHATKV